MNYSVRGKVDDHRHWDGSENAKHEYDLFLTKDKYDDNITIVSEWGKPNIQSEKYMWEKYCEADDNDKRIESEMEILRKHIKKNTISKILERVLRENDLRVIDKQDYYERIKNIRDQLEEMYGLSVKEFYL